MKKTLQIIIYLFILTIIIFPISSVVYAQTTSDYVVLAPLPGIGDSAGGTTNLTSYLPAAFNLAIGVAAVMAFVMITWGGIVYATSDAITSKAQGREWIENALWGLLLVVGAYVILYTINPKILDFELVLPRPKIENVGGAGLVAGQAMTQDQINASDLVAKELGQNPNPCANGQTTNCVNFNGLQQVVIDAILALHNACGGCTINISGGTEAGHSVGSAHSTGRALDILQDSKLNATVSGNKPLVACQTYSYGGGTYLWEPKNSTCGGIPSTGDHWHVGF